MTHLIKNARLVFAIMVVMFCLTSTKLNAQYISATIDWVGDTVIYPATNNNKQLRVRIEVGPTPISLSDLIFNTNGSSNPAADINHSRLWFTGSTDSFNLAIASLVASNPNPWSTNYTFFTTPFTTNSGTNYFWLCYDLQSSAIICDNTGAELINFLQNGVSATNVNQLPNGYSVIGNGCLSGINDYENEIEFSISPNPSSENIQLNISNIPHEKIEINIFDPAGRKVKSIFSGINSEANFEEQFSIEELNSGFYFIVVEGGSVYRQIKFVKL